MCLVRTIALCTLSLLTLASPAVAQVLPADITVREVVNLPDQAPTLTVRATDALSNGRLVIREGGRTVASQALPRMQRGADRVVTWRAEPGVHEYEIELSGRGPEGEARITVQTSVTVMRPLEIVVSRDRVDLEARVIRFSINNPGRRAHVAIRAASGAMLHEADTDLSGRAAGTELEVRWPALSQAIGRIDLRVYDVSDSWVGYELVPFSVEIPHVDVVFASGSHEIPEDQRVHLDEAYGRIVAAIREHGAALTARLYILGHTDTVGTPEANLDLSRRRALSIARYFRARGITLPILARGFGESQLAVQTADSVDEARNRRAQYILAAEAPQAGGWTTVD
jgi:outer membrane protein OmpA-like peptidoglycan-associated protein